MEHVLQQTPNPDLRVLVIWEPILPTDWAAPGSGALARLADPRAVQFWDKGHLFARALRESLTASASHPDCCEQAGNLWDLAALYPKGARWTGPLPNPVFINGPVVRMREQIQSRLSALTSALNGPESRPAVAPGLYAGFRVPRPRQDRHSGSARDHVRYNYL